VDIVDHPVLGRLPWKRCITIYFEGNALLVREGLTVAAALMAKGEYRLGYSRNLSQPRGLYCANGRCQSCLMTIDGVDRVRSCITLVHDGMTIAQSIGDPDLGGNPHEN
jgi:sarcosine oxidase subunit alpha